MNTGLSINDIFLRDFVFNETDLNFSYNLVIKRLKDFNSHIKYITNPSLPSFEDHLCNLHKKFKILKIAVIKDIDVAYLYVDNNNFFGLLYDFSALKHAFKKYPDLKNLRNNFDISEYVLTLLKKLIPKGQTFYAYINPKHTLSINACQKVYEHIANLYAFKNE